MLREILSLKLLSVWGVKGLGENKRKMEVGILIVMLSTGEEEGKNSVNRDIIKV